eukprot:TRINITY_DN6186_c0_g1_i1.p1 TRINITY_DN6186_c0_g1~~TRINITY_DN6186_c0_g1_i1.p1  ORF type:complete len:622 (-),score=203.35 TRINITY_DN6186_c0_g1_i1:18-1883(-)
MESRETRFGYLLQPLKSLAENWNIDIARDLEEYLEELEHITFSFDGVTSLNFAEAALLIQGSACIYSKKVEYLHALLFQTLNFLNEKKKSQATSSIRADGVDEDVYDEEERTEYLNLDDQLEEAEDIDLDDSLIQTPSQQNQLQRLGEVAGGGRSSELRGSFRGAPFFAINDTSDPNKSDFRINTCSVHSSGALLLEGEDRFNLDNFLHSLPSSQSVTSNISTPAGSTSHTENDPFINETADDGDDDDGDGDGEDFEIVAHSNRAESSGQTIPIANTSTTSIGERRSKVAMNDPWKALDPHDAQGGLQKPYKKGKTFKLPPELKNNKKTKNKKPAGFQPTPLAICRPSLLVGSKKWMKSPYFTEFGYLYSNEMKRRAELRQQLQKKMKQEQSNSILSIVNEIEEVDQSDTLDLGLNVNIGADDDGDDGDDDFETDAAPEIIEGVESTPIEPIAMTDNQNSTPSYQDLCRRHIENYLSTAENFVQESSLSKRVAEWKDKLQPVLDDQEHHPVFDIHEYGSKLLDLFPKNKAQPSCALGDLIGKVEMYEVSRYFTSALQLANTGNLEIIKGSSSGDETNTIKLKLLSSNSAFDILNYRAPSMTSSSMASSSVTPTSTSTIKSF